MGNHCSSALKKKDRTHGDQDGDEAADRRRASVESVPYGTPAVTTTQTEDVKASDVSSCPPIALNDKLLTGSPSGEGESGLKETKTTTTEQQSGPILENPNGHSSPAPSSCSPAPPAMQCMNGLFTIPSHPSLVILISAELNQLRVVSIYRPDKPLRTLLNMNQPRDLQLLDPSRALILCNRELFVYNIEQGKLECKVKGVMNQKMPFFGLHSDMYAVALSRNRMYVNMLNLSTGNLETTFKVGEDRFLNSLLVSSNGKICVCGDETQKPFPLLVWDLSSRKLIFDLRIPHHEFITRLAAISNDGHFVVSVCKETSANSFNFIVVYELQNGTLFKKWKPDCNTVSIAISSADSCVVNGLDNHLIQIWDLSTGAIRVTLEGHTAPVDTLRVAECGKYLVSNDSYGRDRIIRVWNLLDGTCLKVYTPDFLLSCCILSATGSHLVMCPRDPSILHVLELGVVETPPEDSYGDIERDGLVIDLSKE